MDLPFDPENKYSIPYFWGTVGIVYQSGMLEEIEKDIELQDGMIYGIQS